MAAGPVSQHVAAGTDSANVVKLLNHSRTALMLAGVGALAVFAETVPATAKDSASLAGQWRFELDRANAGIQQKWSNRSLSGIITLPDGDDTWPSREEG